MVPRKLFVRATLPALLAVLALTGAPARAQSVAPAANLAALVAFPTFYADRTVVVVGHVRDMNGKLWLEDDDGHRVAALWNARTRPEGTGQVTGVLLDLGRLKQDDPRLTGYDTAAVVGTSGQEWPRPGELFVFAMTRFAEADVNAAGKETIRSLVLDGPRAAGRTVTVIGQFRGRNLFGDLPRSPGVSPWDFVLRSAEAAIWVTGKEPKGKDFQFSVDSRIDSNRWIQVTGIVRENRGLTWIEANSLALSKPDPTQLSDTAVQVKPVIPARPAEVVFSIPTPGQTDVSPTATLRIQLSRPIVRESLANHVRISYVGEGPTPPIQSMVDQEENNDAPSGAVAVLVIRFAQPLEAFRTVRVELLEGIKTADGQMLRPWQLTFTVGS